MGIEKVTVIKDPAFRLKATGHLLRDLKALEIMLEKGMFETGVQRIGAEQELSMVGPDWRPSPVIMEILEKVNDERFTTEFARFNLEINFDPLVFSGDCFTQMERQLWSLIRKGEEIANLYDARLIMAGIVPTVRRSDIKSENVTPLERYKSLLDGLYKMRGENFEFRIEGKDQWISRAEDSFLESSNTSFQVHYQLAPQDFAKCYNWALAITGPQLATATNSPLLMGKRLWRETRIALFQQATDVRSPGNYYREVAPRVSFGTGWAGDSVLDVYRDNAVRHKILLATTSDEDALQVLQAGGVPKLYALSVHNGTIYNWNRACYGVTEGKPHIRIENRVLPSGPTVIDEVANAAFWLGLMKGLPEEYADICKKMDFDVARRNFIYAARLGLGANFYWPGSKKQISAEELTLKELLPIAKEGLKKAQVAANDVDRLLGIIEERVSSGKTGSQWMISSFEELSKNASKDTALIALTAGMSRRQQSGQPVHTWDMPTLCEGGSWKNRFQTIEQIMKTEICTVMEDDPVQLVANIMFWRNVRSVPVENSRGELAGLVSCKEVMVYYSNDYREGLVTPVRDIMVKDLVMVSPQTRTLDALKLMRAHNVGSLPVMQGSKLAGLVTESDFVKLAGELLEEAGQHLPTLAGARFSCPKDPTENPDAKLLKT